MAGFDFVVEVGTYADRVYQLGTRVDPEYGAAFDPERECSWAVVLFFEREDGERVVVVRVDDSPHGRDGDPVHVDRLYREEGADRKDFDVDIDSVVDAEDYLEANWLRYARQHRESHERG